MHCIDLTRFQGDNKAFSSVGDVIQLDVHRERCVRLEGERIVYARIEQQPVNDGLCALARGETRSFRGSLRMSSLRQLLVGHAPLLLLDACSAKVQVGWWSGPGEGAWARSTSEAGVGVFKCLEELGIQPDEAGAFVFSDGPGSILGIRTVAMAIRTWQVLKSRPVFSYHSLEIIAHALRRPELTVIADARRDAWHSIRLGSSLHRLRTIELQGLLATPDGFRHWTAMPADVRTVPYELAELLPRIQDADLFRATDSPDAFLHEEPSYVTWTPRIHRAP